MQNPQTRYNVVVRRVQLEPPLTRKMSGEVSESVLTQHELFLPPGRAIEDLIDGGPQFTARHPNPVFKGTATYVFLPLPDAFQQAGRQPPRATPVDIQG